MRNLLTTINLALLIIMSVAYFYHIIYIIVGLVTRKKEQNHPDTSEHSFAVLICARNESAVIAELIGSLKRQKYPSHLLDIYVLADNCTDDTAEKAAKAGALVYSRNDTEHVGKGYALNYMLHKINKEKGYDAYDGYYVFDADNIVDPNFVAEMNKTFAHGYEVITSYRNSKNFIYNWITYGYSVWFLFEARFINSPRMVLGNGCAISGTGFLVSSRIIAQNDGWPFHMLTEDIQFSVNCALTGCKIGYCNNAIVYDEQPETFSQSWTQRMRWAKGFYQIDAKYLGKLTYGALTAKGFRMTCYDILMTVAPSRLLSITVAIFNITLLFFYFTLPPFLAKLLIMQALSFLWATIGFGYAGALLMGILTIASEWKRINASAFWKIAYLPMFPLFLATYAPISIAALVTKNVGWKPIRHYASQLDNVIPAGR